MTFPFASPSIVLFTTRESSPCENTGKVCKRLAVSAPCHFTFLITVLCLCTHHTRGASSFRFFGKKFAVTGPVLTVTLKEPLTNTNIRHPQTYSYHRKPTPLSDLDDTSSPFQRIRLASKNVRDWISDKSDWNDSSNRWIPSSVLSSLSSLSPSLTWSIRSTSPPLPTILPSLRFIAWNIVYQQNPSLFNTWTQGDFSAAAKDTSPSLLYSPLLSLSTQIRFSKRFFLKDWSILHPWKSRQYPTTATDLENHNSEYTNRLSERKIQRTTRGVPISLELIPTHHLSPPETSLVVQLGLGESIPKTDSKARFNLEAHLVSSSSPSPKTLHPSSSSSYSSTHLHTSQPLLQSIHGSYYAPRLPSFTSLQSLSIHPSFDFCTNSPTCILQAQSSSGRTTATLDLNWEDSTFAIMHDIDEYNTISPEISLSTSSIVYHWKVRLDNQGTILTRVDPLSSIDITWIDPTSEGGGKWMTHVQLPLSFDENRNGDWTAAASASASARLKPTWRPNIRVRRSFTF